MAWRKNVAREDKFELMEDLIGKTFENNITGRGIIIDVKKVSNKKVVYWQIYYYTFYEDNPSILAKRKYSCKENTIKYKSILESILD